MKIPKYLIATLALATFALPVSARADSTRCELVVYKPSLVRPLMGVTEGAYGARSERLVGAQLFIPAQPGLTSQWLQADIDRHILALRQRPDVNCPLSVSDTSVTVVPGRTGFWVQISSTSQVGATQVLRLARKVLA